MTAIIRYKIANILQGRGPFFSFALGHNFNLCCVLGLHTLFIRLVIILFSEAISCTELNQKVLFTLHSPSKGLPDGATFNKYSHIFHLVFQPISLPLLPFTIHFFGRCAKFIVGRYIIG